MVTHPRFSDSELDDDGAVGLAEAFAEGNWPDLKELWYVTYHSNCSRLPSISSELSILVN